MTDTCAANARNIEEPAARHSRVAEAGGQLVAAAFAFLGEMIPQRESTNESAKVAGELKARLNECLERDEQGRPRLTVTLPNETALEHLAQSLAALLANKPTWPRSPRAFPIISKPGSRHASVTIFLTLTCRWRASLG